nr:DUF3176 [Penicillium meliponae]
MLLFRGFTYNADIYGRPYQAEFCQSLTAIKTPTTSSHRPASTRWPDKATVFAYGVEVRQADGDFSPPVPHSHHLSTEQKAGIGIGVTLGVFVLFLIGLILFYAWRKRTQQRAARYTPIQQPSMEAKQETPEVTQLASRDEPPPPSIGKAVQLDSWMYEWIAVCFSVACFVAIFCVLQIYNGQLTPSLPRERTLNTIVSLLATASKTALMYVVGECIAQLYDSASRGPWGSLCILIKDRFRSIVTLGAVIVLLALAFDPFVQQLLSYPVLPTLKQSAEAKVLQSRYLLSDNWIGTEFTYAINHGIWSDGGVALDVTCPTGNCTWPQYKSVELCNRCHDIDTSDIVLSGWDLSSFNYSLNQNQSIKANISISGTGYATYRTSFLVEFYDNHPADWGLQLPTSLYWIPEGEGVFESRLDSALDDSDELENPIQSIASLVFDYPEVATIHDSDFLSKVKVVNATMCQLSLCARTYNVTVNDGINSVKVLEEDFGSWYTADTTWEDIDMNTCWKPTSSPMTDWDTTGQSDTASGGAIDLPNFEFCGIDPSYYEAIYTTQGYTGVTGILSNSSSSGIWDIGSSNPASYTFSTGPATERVQLIGVEPMARSIASSLSALARSMSNIPIYGVVSIQQSYVAVKWEWMTLPAVLLVAGILLLIATAFTSTRGDVRLWKSSALPLIFHGLDPGFVSEKIVTEDGQCEAVSKMEEMAENITVYLGVSSEAGRTMLRDASGMPEST